MATPQGNIYGTSLADLYARGMDISMQNPWALAQASFPLAQRSQPGITSDQLLSGAQQFLQPQPGPIRPAFTPADQLAALDTMVPGMTTPDAPMSQDTGYGGRTALDMALNHSLNPAALALTVMGMFAGPFGPIGAKAGLKGIQMHNQAARNDIINAELDAMGNVNINTDPVTGPMGVGIANPGMQGAGAPAASAGEGVGPPGSGVGPGGEGAGAPGPTGGTGPGEGGGGATYKKGGYIGGKGKKAPQHGAKFHPGFDRAKGTKIVPIKAHEGEFVMNPAATKAYGPQLEAMNALIPPEALDSLIGKANRFFGG